MTCGSIPAKADCSAQRQFCDNVLYPLMEKANEGKISLIFMDASHFVLGCDFLGGVYCRIRRFIRTFSGRKRYNVLGAIDYVTKHVLTVANDTYITASEVCEMMRKISVEYADRAVHVVLDNAKYQKCAAVRNLAAELGIILEYIPPYSPNLNLIERLWKFVKGELRSKYYGDFDVFCKRIDSIISSTTKENASRIKSLIGKGVQLFDDMKPITESTLEATAKKERQVI